MLMTMQTTKRSWVVSLCATGGIMLSLITSSSSKTIPSIHKDMSKNLSLSSFKKHEKTYADLDDIPYDNCNGTSLKSYNLDCLLGAGWHGAVFKVNTIGAETWEHTFALKVQEKPTTSETKLSSNH